MNHEDTGSMDTRRRYRKKPDQFVVAVQLALDTNGFTYKKWGAEQRCKRGDWLVKKAANSSQACSSGLKALHAPNWCLW